MMMQEVSSDEHEAGKIASELEEAAQTNVTQASLENKEGSPPRSSPAPSIPSSSSSISSLPPPSQLPALGSPAAASILPPPTVGFVPTPLPTSVQAASPQKTFPEIDQKVVTPSPAPFVPASVSLPASPMAPTNTVPPVSQSMETPHEATTSIDLQMADPRSVTSVPMYSQQQDASAGGAGFFGWFGSGIVNKVVEKTKNSVESVITTLDPGMRDVIYSGGDFNILVASGKEVKVGAVRQAFQEVFGHATVDGLDSQPGIAPQPVGYSAGIKGCEERLQQLRRNANLPDQLVLVAIENFIAEVLPDKWYDIGCVLLKDQENNIELSTFTQATPIPSEYVQQAQDLTPADYDLRWSGLKVTIGQVIQSQKPEVSHADWHKSLTGVSRRDMLYLAAKQLAGIYKQKTAKSGN